MRRSPFGFGHLAMLAAMATPFALPAQAQLTDADRTGIAEQIRMASANLDAERLPPLAEAKELVRLRIEEAERYVAAKTSVENAAAWLKYLDLQPLHEAVSQDDVAAMGRESIGLRYRLIGTAPGLELPAFRSLRDAVEDLVAAILFRDRDRSLALITRQLEALAKQVGQLDDSPSSEDVATISTIMALLQSSNQAEDVVAKLRSTFNRPNVAILIGEPLVQEAVQRSVNETNPVTDCILGTRFVGTARLSGVVTANLLPSVGSVRMQIAMTGQVRSNNTGYNGPVRLRTAGFGDVYATRMIHISEAGLNMEPEQISGRLRNEIRRIEHRLRLVRNIARKKAAQQKPQADRIAERRMLMRIGRGFKEQTERANRLAAVDTLAQVRPMLQRLSLAEPSRLWGSTDQELFIDTLFRGPDQLGAVVSRPPVSGNDIATIQVHESVIDNACAPNPCRSNADGGRTEPASGKRGPTGDTA